MKTYSITRPFKLLYHKRRSHWLKLRFKIYYVAKYEESLRCGGPEEGGWYYDEGYPQWRFCIPIPIWEELSYAICRYFNNREHERRDQDNKYGYTSVLSYRDTFYCYGHSDTFKPKPYPEVRPHYE